MIENKSFVSDFPKMTYEKQYPPSPNEIIDALEKEICELLTLQVEKCKNKDNSDLGKKIYEAKNAVAKARNCKEQLKGLYAKRKEDREKAGVIASKEEFLKKKEEYFDLVVTAGQTKEKRKELEQEVKKANKDVAKLQEELFLLTGKDFGCQNMWQLDLDSKAGLRRRRR